MTQILHQHERVSFCWGSVTTLNIFVERENENCLIYLFVFFANIKFRISICILSFSIMRLQLFPPDFIISPTNPERQHNIKPLNNREQVLSVHIARLAATPAVSKMVS